MAASARAQQKIASVRIFTDLPGLAITIDGQPFGDNDHAVATLFWPAGSKHSITRKPVQFELDGRTRYTSHPCETNIPRDPPGSSAILDSQCLITADPDLTFVRIKFDIEYALDLTYFVCPANTDATFCQSPGTVFITV
jgi:hypothetical protein